MAMIMLEFHLIRSSLMSLQHTGKRPVASSSTTSDASGLPAHQPIDKVNYNCPTLQLIRLIIIIAAIPRRYYVCKHEGVF